jgi:hypothetical protein
MSEREWLGCEEPAYMLRFLGERPSGAGRDWRPPQERKDAARRWACAVLRRFWADLGPAGRLLVEHAEIGVPAREEVNVEAALEAGVGSADGATPAVAACWVDRLSAGAPPGYAYDPFGTAISVGRVCAGACAPREQASLLRCCVNPFAPAFTHPRRDWGADAATLARAALADAHPETGALDPLCLSALADSLEEAGCLDQDLLLHLRGRERVWDDFLPGWRVRASAAAHAKHCRAVAHVLSGSTHASADHEQGADVPPAAGGPLGAHAAQR